MKLGRFRWTGHVANMDESLTLKRRVSESTLRLTILGDSPEKRAIECVYCTPSINVCYVSVSRNRLVFTLELAKLSDYLS